MGLGEPWTENTAGSASKKNITSVITDSGTNLTALDKTKFKLLSCNSTSGGLTADHLYMTNAAGDALIDVTSVVAHTHTNSTTGGSLISVYISNSAIMDLCLTKTQDLQKANWIQTVTSTGSIEDATDGTSGERSIRLRPNGTSGSGSTISYPHLKLDFAKSSIFETKLRIETATDFAFHTGVGADDVTAADSNTRKYNAEVCTATNLNWWLRSANGSANSSSDSGIAISTSRVAMAIVHQPTLTTVDLYIDANSVFSKTTNVPTSGASADNNIIKHSIKNSTAADRPIHVYGSRLRYTVNDNWL